MPIQGMPPIPPLPDFLGNNPASFTLQTTAETKKIHGFSCQKHTLKLSREGQLTLWLTEDKALFPFHRLRHQGPHPFGTQHSEWPDKLAALLRSRGLFPLLLVLRDEPEPGDQDSSNEQSPELLRWEVTSYTAKTIADTNENLFIVPEKFHQLDKSLQKNLK